jgi:mono/diheme cytochrome c family protein
VQATARAVVTGLAVALGLASGLGAGSSGCGKGHPSGAPDGTALFEQICARCHGVDGKGVPEIRLQLGVPDMTDPAWQSRHADADIRRTVHQGSRSKKMPAFGDYFSDEQIDAIIGHVRKFRRP